MFGGFVQWQRGERPDGTDSLALQVAPETHWPELRVLVLVVSGEKKPVGSTAGMQTSVETSPLLKHRAEAVVPERLAQMMKHIQERDFEGFGQLAMRDSNQFHATCLDTFPPIFYLTDLSRQIIALAHRYNTHHGHTKVPAGPWEGHSTVVAFPQVPTSPQCHHRSPTPSMPAPTPSSSRWPTPWPSLWRW
ncbi:hypothetical protein Nmel_012073 [Mimus melanotis]